MSHSERIFSPFFLTFISKIHEYSTEPILAEFNAVWGRFFYTLLDQKCGLSSLCATVEDTCPDWEVLMSVIDGAVYSP